MKCLGFYNTQMRLHTRICRIPSIFLSVLFNYSTKLNPVCRPKTGLENREYGLGIRCADHATPLYPQKLALTSPTSSGRLVGIVRLRTKATELVLPPHDTVVTEKTTTYASVETSIRVCCSVLLSTGGLELMLRTVNRITPAHLCLKGPRVVLVGVATYM
jgi:hypothetical protein